jgi:signal transduction histidine kinase
VANKGPETRTDIDGFSQTELQLHASKAHPPSQQKADILSLAASLPDTPLEGAFARYLVAFGAAMVALLVQGSLRPLLGDHFPYVAFFPAMALCAWLCGLGPSIMAVLLALAGVRYWLLSPAHALSTPDRVEVPGMVAFLVAAGCIVAIGVAVRHRQRAVHSALELQIIESSSELETAKQDLGELAGRLLNLQDEERRRIARELHDSVGQTIAALSMNLSAVGADLERLQRAADTIADSAALVDGMGTDIRTISYLLHPPLLDEAGLSSALRWYIRGFAERSKIKVHFDFPEDFGRLPQDLEIAIFRVIQECLINIHRHAESPVAMVRLTRSLNEVCVEVEDHGKGIPEEKKREMDSHGLLGVGMRGMRERLRQLGGSLEVISPGEGQGTTVVARLPDSSESSGLAATASAGSAV